MSSPSTERPPAATPRRLRWTPRRILLLVAVAYGLLLVLLNLDSVAVNFVFFKTEAALFVVILLALALGFLCGWLFDDVRERKRRK